MIVADHRVRLVNEGAAAVRPNAAQDDDPDQRDQCQASEFDGREQLDYSLTG
jgi:hypothetical protein